MDIISYSKAAQVKKELLQKIKDHKPEISDVVGLSSQLNGKLDSETTTTLSLVGDNLTYVDEAGNTTTIDLSGYLDEDARAIDSGVLNGTTGIVTFTRDDTSTFTLDLSSLLDDTNLARITSASFNTTDGNLTLTRDDALSSTVVVDLDGRYELADVNILKSSHINSTVQPYNANTVVDSSYKHIDVTTSSVKSTDSSGTEIVFNKYVHPTTHSVSTIVFDGSVVPTTDVTFDLGSATHRFRDLYLSGSTIKLGSASLSASGTGLVLPSGSKIDGSGNLLDSDDIGSDTNTDGTVQPYDANTVVDSSYKHITVSSTSVSDGTNTFNQYTHPTTHAATVITEDSTHRFVTDTEKTDWNSKAEGDHDHTGVYEPVDASIVKDNSYKHIDVTTSSVKSTDSSGTEITFNQYTHPANHPATVITQDTTHRFVTDTEKTTWNSKAAGDHDHTGVYETADSDLVKDANYVHITVSSTSVSDGTNTFNQYTHPANHPATLITQDATHRFVTDTEKTDWNSKLSSETVTSLSLTANELKYTDEDGTITKLDLTTYLDDTNLARIISGTYDATTTSLIFTRDDTSTFSVDASMFFDDTNLVTSVAGKTGAVTLTKSDISDFNESDYGTSTHDHTGVYEPADSDLVKDANYVHITVSSTSVSDGTNTFNQYTHPATHAATLITQDTTHRFVTDTEKTDWNSKATGNHNHTGVYEPVNSSIVKDSSYKHITVSNTSVSDGTNTFTKYDDTNVIKTTDVASTVSTSNKITTQSDVSAVLPVKQRLTVLTQATGDEHFDNGFDFLNEGYVDQYYVSFYEEDAGSTTTVGGTKISPKTGLGYTKIALGDSKTIENASEIDEIRFSNGDILRDGFSLSTDGSTILLYCDPEGHYNGKTVTVTF